TIGAVTGRMVHPGALTGLPVPALHGQLGFLDINFDHGQRMDVPTVCGANMSFRREVVLALGGFDERYIANAFRWETDFSLRLLAAGYRIRYDPTAHVIHHYGTPGGCENANLLARTTGSHAWYDMFFRNSIYFA